MITCKISAGSSTIVQDIIDMAVSLAPIGNWQGFVYNSATGSKPWCVWLQRMDEDAHELQYVSSSGLAAPPDGYELITVSCPTTTGFSLSFTSVNSMPTVLQTKGGGGGVGGRVNAQGYPNITIRMSGNSATNLTDFQFMVNNLTPAGTASLVKVFYKSSGGSQPWAVYAFRHSFAVGNPPGTLFTFTMSGVASPPAGSEQLAVACPSTTTLAADGYTQIAVPLQVG